VEHQLSEAKQLYETYDFGEASQMLQEGWTLHSMWPDQNKTRYILLKF